MGSAPQNQSAGRGVSSQSARDLAMDLRQPLHRFNIVETRLLHQILPLRWRRQ